MRLLRISAEHALRGVALGALGVVLWRWTHPAPEVAPAVEVVAGAALGDALRRWTGAEAGAGHVALDGAPDAEGRAWLRALGGAGMRVTWSARAAPALAASAWPVVDPAGGVRVEVAAPVGTAVAVGDATAAGDTLRAAGGGATVTLPAAGAGIVARVGATAAHPALAAAPRLGAVVVLARAGWEAKFVAAALEERGWPVRLRVSVAPGIDVTQGGAPGAAALALDTATTAAVVALDSSAAAHGAAIARFVRAGGGLVLAAEAAESPALRALAAGAVGAPVTPVPAALDGATPRRGLALRPIVPRADALVLERRDGATGEPAVAARRVGAGRVAQVGFEETWRWRMAADDASPAAHRAWWARVVGAVAYAPNAPAVAHETLAAGRVSHDRSSTTDPAPLASAIAALGPQRASPPTARRGRPTGPRPSDGTLAALAGAALLAEVASRRMRGTR